jgi:hypothetical protein
MPRLPWVVLPVNNCNGTETPGAHDAYCGRNRALVQWAPSRHTFRPAWRRNSPAEVPALGASSAADRLSTGRRQPCLLLSGGPAPKDWDHSAPGLTRDCREGTIAGFRDDAPGRPRASTGRLARGLTHDVAAQPARHELSPVPQDRCRCAQAGLPAVDGLVPPSAYRLMQCVAPGLA